MAGDPRVEHQESSDDASTQRVKTLCRAGLPNDAKRIRLGWYQHVARHTIASELLMSDLLELQCVSVPAAPFFERTNPPPTHPASGESCLNSNFRTSDAACEIGVRGCFPSFTRW
jgi:hypothetical protein